MKQLYYLLVSALYCLLLSVIDAVAQEANNELDDISVNSLSAPASPGSVLLGVNPTEIQKPTDLTGLMISLRNATDNFTQLPVSFAIDMAPAWLFKKDKISFTDYVSSKKSFMQTFTLSYAQLSQDDQNYKGLKQGLGFSFSLVRPPIRDTAYLHRVANINMQLKNLLEASDMLLAEKKAGSQLYQQLDSQVLNYQNRIIALSSREHQTLTDSVALTNLATQLLLILSLKDNLDNKLLEETKQEIDELRSDEIESLNSLSKTITPVRKGFFLDVAGGTIARYDNFQVNKTRLTNSALWLTTGWDGNSNDESGKSTFSFFLFSRFVYKNADEWYKSGNTTLYNTFDNGIKLSYATASQKFLVSAEALGRKLYNTDAAKTFVYKYLVNVQWAVGMNQVLTFTYGKDFNNHITRDGNVIGYLNFVQGLFARKSLEQ